MAKAWDAISLVVHTNMPIKGDERMKKPFSPATTYQIFGSDGIIVGYRNVEIQIMIEAHSLHYHIQITRKDRELKAADLQKILVYFAKWFPSNHSSIHRFQYLVEHERYRSYFGTIADYFTASDDCQIMFTYCDRQSPTQMSFHRRLESIAVFFIDDIRKIEYSSYWSIVYVYKNVEDYNFPVGFATLIKYDDIVKVAQMFIFPNFQGLRIGTALLQLIYKMCRAESTCRAIDVDNPCVAFQVMRDRLDVEILFRSNFNFMTTPYEAFRKNIRVHLKLIDEQIRHLYRAMGYIKADNPLVRKKFLWNLKLELIEEAKPFGPVSKKQIKVGFMSYEMLYKKISKTYNEFLSMPKQHQ